MSKVLSRTVSIYVDGKQVESTLSSLGRELQNLKNKQKKLTIGTDEYIEAGLKIKEINGVIRETNRAMEETDTLFEKSLENLSNIADIVEGLKSLSDFGGAVIGSLKDLVYAAAEMDDAYSDVMKTTGLTHDQVKELNDEFKRLDTRTSREELNKLAYEAGKLGINTKEAVAQFVSASDKINIALGDVLGEGSMVTIGKLADVYAKSTKQLTDAGDDLEKKMLAIGSAVNQLGQESTANEAYLVEFMSRMGGIATQANLSADAILGFASALDQDMMKQEMSATAFQKFIMQLIKAPADFAKAAGMEVEQFTDLVKTDMNEALLAVLEGFQGSGGLVELQPIFEDLGLDAARAASVISSMANSVDQIRAAQASANEQLSTGSSILNEFNTKNNNMQAQADKAKKAFEDMRIELGEQLYPVVIHMTRASTVALKGLSGYLTLWKENKAAAVSLTGALATLVGWYTKSYLTKIKDRVAQLALNAQKKISTLTTNLQAAAEARHAAQLEKTRLATLKQQLAIQQKIIADRAEYQAMGANSVVLAAERNSRMLAAQITKQQTVVTEANTVATNANKAALASTPWGLVLTAVTALGVGMYKLVKNQRQFSEETKELNKQIGDETSRATYLFDKLKTLDDKTDEYKDVLSKLNDLYPDILSKYTDEEGKLTNLANARQAVIDKIREQITEQRKLDKYGDIAGSFESEKTDALERIREYLIGKNSKKGDQQYSSLLAKLPSTYDTKADLSGVLGIVRRSTGIETDRLFGFDKLYIAISDYVNSINKAYDAQKKWESVFGDGKKGSNWNAFMAPNPTGSTQAESTSSSSTSTSDTELDKAAIKAAEQEAKRAAKELEERRKKSIEAVEKILSDYASRGTIETVNTALNRKDQEITDSAKALMEANTTKQKDGTIKWVSEEAEQLYINLVKSRDEVKKGVINDWLMKLSSDTNDLSQRLNDLAMVDISAIESVDPQAAQDFRDLIDYYKNLAEAAKQAGSAIDETSEALGKDEPLQKWIDALDLYVSKVADIAKSINTIISNYENRQFQESQKYHDQKVVALEAELEQGIISQEEYNEKKQQLDKNLEAEQKEIERRQFNREKALSIAEATISGSLAALRVLADPTYQGAARWVQFGLVTAAALAQIAAIASEPAPYAKGGYTREPTILVGERGQEWVASNRLLRDPATAPIIHSLEQYQRGNKSALDAIAMQGVDMSAVRSVAARRQQQQASDAAMLSELRLLRQYLSDPQNRQAVISRTTQEAFDANENFLRNARKI